MDSFLEMTGSTTPNGTLGKILVAGIVVTLTALFAKLLSTKRFRDIPEPPLPSWIWGHMLKVHNTPAGDHYGKWFDQYGPTIKLKTLLGMGEVLVSVDPSLIHHIFTGNCYNYTKSTLTRPFVERVLGHGLVWAEGDMHKLQRRQLVSAFSPSVINRMFPAISDVAHKCAFKISSHIVKEEDILDVHDLVAKTTLDIFGVVALNHEFDCLDGGAADIRNKWTRQGNNHIRFSGFLAVAMLRTFPWIANLPIATIQEQGSVKSVVNPLAHQIISNGRDNAQVSAFQGTDLLSTLLRSGEMSDSQLVDNISTFIVAGFDSTSAALTWALHAMACNIPSQERLRAELLGLGREPTSSDFASMEFLPYFDAVCKETLRLFPATDAERVALEDDVVSLCFPIVTQDGERIEKIHIRKGDTIIIPLICSNRLNAVWRDGAVWRPERWLEELPPKTELPQGWANLITFSEGPRNCIGYRLALLELKVILSTLIRQFIFTIPRDNFEVEGHYFASLLPVVKGEEDKGAYMPLKIQFYESR